MEAIFKMKKDEAFEDIFDDENIQKCLITPIIDKIRLHIDSVSE